MYDLVNCTQQLYGTHVLFSLLLLLLLVVGLANS
jgi:hypothetical protein